MGDAPKYAIIAGCLTVAILMMVFQYVMGWDGFLKFFVAILVGGAVGGATYALTPK